MDHGVHQDNRDAGDFRELRGVEGLLEHVLVFLRGRLNEYVLRGRRLQLGGVERKQDVTWRRQCVAALRTGAHRHDKKLDSKMQMGCQCCIAERHEHDIKTMAIDNEYKT